MGGGEGSEGAELVNWSVWASLCCSNKGLNISVASNSQDFFLFVPDDLGCNFVPCHPCLRIQAEQTASMPDVVGC